MSEIVAGNSANQFSNTDPINKYMSEVILVSYSMSGKPMFSLNRRFALKISHHIGKYPGEYFRIRSERQTSKNQLFTKVKYPNPKYYDPPLFENVTRDNIFYPESISYSSAI